MDVTYSMISVNTGRIREKNRRDLVNNYCKTLDTDFSILPETHVNFSHLYNIMELWNGDVVILPGKTQTCGVLVLAKRTVLPVEHIISGPAGRYVFFKIKNTADAVLALHAPSGSMKERRIGRKMFIRKTKNLLYKNITRKNNLMLMGNFNVTLGNKDRSTGNKGFCEP